MKLKNFLLFVLIVFIYSCSKDKIEIAAPPPSEKALIVYQEAMNLMDEGQFFAAAKKFSEAELIMPKFEQSAKASILSSYCYYKINFYDESLQNLDTFVSKYTADTHLQYAYYLSAIISFEQIVDEKKDLTPLIDTKKKIDNFILNFPDSEYALDLKFKLGLVKNQMAAKEMYIARHYIDSEKWVPAINRLQTVVKRYDETIFIEEALYRLVEIYYKVGLEDEAIKTANILGYNYQSSEWYEKSYLIFNKDYKAVKIEKEKEDNLITRAIKKILR